MITTIRIGVQEIVVAPAAGFPAGTVGLTIRGKHGDGIRSVLSTEDVQRLVEALVQAGGVDCR